MEDKMVSRHECDLCKEGIRAYISSTSERLTAEIKALRRELVIAVTVSTALISIFISIQWW